MGKVIRHIQNGFITLSYASKKDVLFVHAAGNDGKNVNPDKYPNYPNDFENGKEIADNTITVGASSWDYSENNITSFELWKY